MNAISWLGTHTDVRDVVLTGYYPGTLIPAFSGNRVYVSWWYRLVESPGLDLTEYTVNKFYTGTMTGPEAAGFLKTAGISYVLRSEGEKTVRPDLKYLPYAPLTVVYDRDGVVIYKVTSAL
jgi:hypothetical protein